MYAILLPLYFVFDKISYLISLSTMNYYLYFSNYGTACLVWRGGHHNEKQVGLGEFMK